MTVIPIEPSSELLDERYSMSSTPLTCCSIGTATLSATTGALAPGQRPVTDTVGGVMSGVSSMGRLGMDTAPSSEMTMEITRARTGR